MANASRGYSQFEKGRKMRSAFKFIVGGALGVALFIAGVSVFLTAPSSPSAPKELIWKIGTATNVANAPKSLIGGRDAELGEAPWFVQISMIYQGSTGHCGGAVVGSHVVGTAAHCLTDDDGKFNFDQLSLRIGSIDRDGIDAWNVISTSAAVHSLYWPAQRVYYHDLAFICLPQAAPVVLDGVGLPDIGSSAAVYGMGLNEQRQLSPRLKTADLRVTDRGGPALALQGITGSFRQGDSGGPIVQDGKWVGIVSTFVPLAGDPIAVPLTAVLVQPFAHLIERANQRCIEVAG